MARPRIHHDERTERHRAAQRKRRNERKELFVRYKGNKCYDCGNTYPLCCYDFHHLDERQKLFEIAPGLDRALGVLYEEVDKCVLLCSNCHRIRHSIDSPTLK